MSVAIIDYGSGNLHSAAKAFERAARDNGLAVAVEVTADPAVLRRAERLVLPGVGAFKDCRNGLMSVPGLWQTLEEEVVNKGKPFLGICVGMQLMASRGLEHDVTEGFGWIPGDVKPITPRDPSLKIPHMGWNTLVAAKSDLYQDLPDATSFYFVHSYHPVPADETLVSARCEYGEVFAASISRGAIHAVQFHPEKSQSPGLAVLKNFLVSIENPHASATGH